MRKAGRRILLYTCLALVPGLALINAGCSGGGGGGGANPPATVQLTGTVSAVSGTTAPVPPGAGKASQALLVQTADTIWAIPIAKMQGANIDRMNVLLRKAAALDLYGNFTFDLSRKITIEEIIAVRPEVAAEQIPAGTTFDVDWMLVTMSAGIPLNVVELPGSESYDGMVSIPLSAFTLSSMPLGTVNSADGSASLTVSGIANDVTLSSDSLAALSRTDDILSSIKNIIRNCNVNDNKCVSASMGFVFLGNYNNIASAVTTSYDKAIDYTGYQIPFDVSDYFEKTDFDGICTGPSATVIYTLIPPGPVPVGTSTTYTISNPWTSGTGPGNIVESTDYTKCFKNDLYVGKSKTSGDWMLQFLTGDMSSSLTKSLPSGDWVLTRTDVTTAATTTVGTFEFSLANPVDGNDNPIIFVPGVRIDTTNDGTGDQVTTVHIKWYQYNGSTYVEVTDTALLNDLLGEFDLSLSDQDGIDSNSNERYDQARYTFDTSSVDVSNYQNHGAFYYNDTASTAYYNMDYLGISYMFGGQNFRFVWANYVF